MSEKQSLDITPVRQTADAQSIGHRGKSLLSPFRWLSPAGSRGRLSIFIFHRVVSRNDALRPGEPDVDRFDRIVRFISSNFKVLSLPAAAALLAQGHLPAAAACITFDDGYADNLTLAAPILSRYRATATVFVSTAYTDGGRMWNDSLIEAVRAAPAGELDWREFGLGAGVVGDDASRRSFIAEVLPRLKYRALDERSAIAEQIASRAGLASDPTLMLTRQQLREWRDLGFDVGGHTVSHPILARLDEAQAADEIAHGREQLAQWLGEAPQAFAYPNGVPGRDFGARDVSLVQRAGYTCAVTTAAGAASRHTDPYRLPRFTPWDRSMWAFGLRCARTILASRHAAEVDSSLN